MPGQELYFSLAPFTELSYAVRQLREDKSFGVLTVQQVFHHGDGRHDDTHRLSITADPDDTFARVRLSVFCWQKEL